MRRPGRRSGLTLVEVALAGGSSLVIALALGGVVTAANGLADRSKAQTHASQEHRRGLERIANAVRGADADGVTGFDGSGTATTLTFQTVTGLSGGFPELSSTVEIRWQATGPVAGVDSPGEVVLVQDGIEIRLASRVPEGGFTVTEMGAAYTIHLETFSPLPNGEIARANGDTTVLLRN